MAHSPRCFSHGTKGTAAEKRWKLARCVERPWSASACAIAVCDPRERGERKSTSRWTKFVRKGSSSASRDKVGVFDVFEPRKVERLYRKTINQRPLPQPGIGPRRISQIHR